MKKHFLLTLLLGALLPLVAAHADNYDVDAYAPRNPNNVSVKVSIRNQMVYVMEGNTPLMVVATCVGVPGKPTPTGNFRVTSMLSHKRSGSYGFYTNGTQAVPGESGHGPSGWRYVGYPMPYWVEFSPGYGFHEGYVWPQPRTHGCLRLNKNVAGKFFALVKDGTPINIAQTQPEDATLGKNAKRPKDYLDADPPAMWMISDAPFSKPTPKLKTQKS